MEFGRHDKTELFGFYFFRWPMVKPLLAHHQLYHKHFLGLKIVFIIKILMAT